AAGRWVPRSSSCRSYRAPGRLQAAWSHPARTHRMQRRSTPPHRHSPERTPGTQRRVVEAANDVNVPRPSFAGLLISCSVTDAAADSTPAVIGLEDSSRTEIAMTRRCVLCVLRGERL